MHIYVILMILLFSKQLSNSQWYLSSWITLSSRICHIIYKCNTYSYCTRLPYICAVFVMIIIFMNKGGLFVKLVFQILKSYSWITELFINTKVIIIIGLLYIVKPVIHNLVTYSYITRYSEYMCYLE